MSRFAKLSRDWSAALSVAGLRDDAHLEGAGATLLLTERTRGVSGS
jgi:hypothetical protein